MSFSSKYSYKPKFLGSGVIINSPIRNIVINVFLEPKAKQSNLIHCYIYQKNEQR